MEKRKLTAVMFTDIKGYTALMSRDEKKALEIINTTKELIINFVTKYNGRFIKEMGDGTLSIFESASDAIHCAKAIQYDLINENEYKLRIGLHLGEIVHSKNDVYGDGVNIASRIEPLATPGGVAISGEMYSALKSHSDIVTEFQGEKELKNVTGLVSIYKVVVDGNIPDSTGLKKHSLNPLTLLKAAIFIFIPIIAIFIVTNVLSSEEVAIPDEPAIAILPFDNFTGHDDQEYFADAVTEMITSKTAQIRDLRVISRTSVMPFKNMEANLDEVANALQVHYVLEGSVLRDGDRIRIVAQLIQVRPEKHIWREEYDRDFTDTLTLMNDIAKNIAEEIHIVLSQEENALFSNAPKVNTQAFMAYEKGRFQLSQNTPDSIDRAIILFENSLEHDEKFVSAYAGLSTAYLRRFVLGGGDLDEALNFAEHYVNKALDLDNNLPESIEAYAYLLTIKRDYDKAEKEFLRAIELRPSFAEARSHFSELYDKRGESDKAIEQLRMAQEIDPINSDYDLRIGWIYQNKGLFQEAIDQYLQVLELNPQNQMAMTNLIQSYGFLGLYEQALDIYEENMHIFDENSISVLRDILFYSKVMSGKFSNDAIQEELRELEDLYNNNLYQPYLMSIAYYITDHRDSAFEALEKGYATNDSFMYYMKDDIWDEDFRNDPRYISLYKRIYSE